MSFERFLQLIRDGEPVQAGVPNRPIAQLDQNIKYLWDVIQAANLGSTVYAREQTIAPEVVVGTPVYYNSVSQRFEPGLANMETDGNTGQILTSASSQIWGVVDVKHNATLADILLFGYADIDIAGVTDNGTVYAGLYYLSGTEPGKLTQQRPPVSVPTLRADGDGRVYVNPNFVDFLDNHRHYRFELTASPAGDHSPPTPGERHVISNVDPDLPGWLPADHAIFDGKAPANAVYGYNLSAHPVLDGIWPPIPINQVHMEWDRAVGPEEGLIGIPLGGPHGLAIVDRYGIWWMSDCYGDVPWPKNLDTNSSESLSIGSEPECPRYIEFKLLLWFTKVQFATDATVVTSLASRDSRLKVYCVDTTKIGSTGDLELDLDLGLSLGVDTLTSHLAVKTINDETSKLDRGPVAVGLFTTGSTVFLTSNVPTTTIDEQTVHHGLVQIEVVTEGTVELKSQIVRLDGATEEHYPVIYLGFNPNSKSSFRARFEVPADAPANSEFRFRPRILGRAAGNLPQLIVTYNVLSRPVDGLNTPIDLDDTFVALTIDTVATLTDANQAVEATSDPITVSPGDILEINVERDPDDAGDEYAGEVGIMQQVGVLTAPES